jgi:predicted N-acetyltransferase YhbS
VVNAVRYTSQPEEPDDEAQIERLLDSTFGLTRRTKTSYRLREGSRPVPGLSLVVRDDEIGVIGSISFWPLKIGEQGSDAILLGPLAVHQRRQSLGVGRLLMRDGLEKAKHMGCPLVLLVGDEPYYARVGFKKIPHDKIDMPGPLNRNRFLFLELQPGALSDVSGMVLPPHRFAARSAPLAVPHR